MPRDGKAGRDDDRHEAHLPRRELVDARRDVADHLHDRFRSEADEEGEDREQGVQDL